MINKTKIIANILSYINDQEKVKIRCDFLLRSYHYDKKINIPIFRNKLNQLVITNNEYCYLSKENTNSINRINDLLNSFGE